MVRRPAAPARQPLLVALLTALVVLAAVITVLGVRADREAATAARTAQAEADDREARERAALDEAASAEAERDATRAAERDAAALAVGLMWSATTADAAARVATSEALLTSSEGRLSDDAVRLTLAQTVDAVRPLLARGDRPPGDLRAAATTLDRALTALGAASTAVSEAQGRWQAEQDAAASAAQAADAQRRTAPGSAPGGGLGGPPSTGAGPDCGGPESYEPPKDDGSPVFYTSTPTTSGDGSNGRVPSSAMDRLGWCTDSQGNGQWLRADAAAALTRMNDAFRTEFGENIAVDLSYRSYEDQVQMREYYGSAAARPGTSNHGLGLAFDTWEWAAYGFGSPRYEWLVANAPSYGWVAPTWARQAGSNPEYWHFEFVG